MIPPQPSPPLPLLLKTLCLTSVFPPPFTSCSFVLLSQSIIISCNRLKNVPSTCIITILFNARNLREEDGSDKIQVNKTNVLEDMQAPVSSIPKEVCTPFNDHDECQLQGNEPNRALRARLSNL